MAAALKPGGELHIADYAAQTSPLMRSLFRLTVQRLDGMTDTQPNADGAIEAILSDLVGAPVAPRRVIPTLTGASSLFHFTVPERIYREPFQQLLASDVTGGWRSNTSQIRLNQAAAAANS